MASLKLRACVLLSTVLFFSGLRAHAAVHGASRLAGGGDGGAGDRREGGGSGGRLPAHARVRVVKTCKERDTILFTETAPG
uniref:Uncharacterized protein n=1 Tax=Oryza meridionalis TaxID=40149 RepID=A0A0E0C452_9ORYZ